MDKVRAILREAEQHERVNVGGASLLPGRPRLLSLFAGYAGWNLAASMYGYRVVGNEAAARLAESGGAEEAVVVQLHLTSWQIGAELSTLRDDGLGGEAATPRRRVRVLPHLYLTDALFGRSRWCLTCRKANGHTAWSTTPPEEGEPGAGGFSWSSSSSSSGRWA